MRITNTKKVGALVTLASTIATSSFAATTTLTSGLADWVSLVAEILSFVCLAIFIIYAGKYITTSSKGGDTGAAENVRMTEGVKNGIMTALVGIGICQAVIIVAQALFVK